ncbi:MAG: [Fe-Fe] hydrogenase large subunit C-terminal domain-containing protein [Candidatus Eisenbacteria bacterium]|nr:[Fe-Fe] hydrogenase large subunit C-terminal domain-containing protein [Candidatus Eisenbacteria bacterium]
MSVAEAPDPSILIDRQACIGCVACCRACPTKAIRVRDGLAVIKRELCIDCGECIRICPQEAARAKTSSSAALERFRYTVAMPSLTLYGQFGRDVDPGQILRAFTRIGFDSSYDISWMCEMVAGATDAQLAECRGPWPKISVTCPSIVRLVQIRYPDMIPHLVPIESARELAAKMLRRKLSLSLHLDPKEIGIFFITPCSAVMNSIMDPVGLEQSHLDGAFSIAELYADLRRAIDAMPKLEAEDPVSPRGLLWAMAGGEIAGMRNANSMTVKGVQDVEYVFDRMESGKFQAVDFIEAYICPDGCVSGPLTIEGRYAAQRNILRIGRRLSGQSRVKEERIRSLIRDHFFDLEEGIAARPVQRLANDLRTAIAAKREQDEIRSQLPKKNCGACGSPDCETLAEDVWRGEARMNDCPFLRIQAFEGDRKAHEEKTDE